MSEQPPPWTDEALANDDDLDQALNDWPRADDEEQQP